MEAPSTPPAFWVMLAQPYRLGGSVGIQSHAIEANAERILRTVKTPRELSYAAISSGKLGAAAAAGRKQRTTKLSLYASSVGERPRVEHLERKCDVTILNYPHLADNSIFRRAYKSV